jgi:acyl-CoA synthetase (AMP-forming)/AMP-acid ligase II
MDIPKLEFIWKYLKHWSSKNPELPFIEFKEKKYSFKQLDESVDHLSEAFINLGLKKGDRIVTILPMSVEFTLIHLAANSIGAICVPMDVRFRPADFNRFIPHVKPKIVFLIGRARGYNIAKTIKKLSSDFDSNIKYYNIGGEEFGTLFDDLLKKNYNLKSEVEKVRSKLNPDEGALIIFTGGTTGVPKAALLSHRNVAYGSYYITTNLINRLESLGFKDRIKSHQNFPPSHVGGIIGISGAALAGNWEMIMEEQWNPHSILKTIQKYKLPLAGGVSTMIKILLNLPDFDNFDLSSLKFVINSSEKIGMEVLKNIKEKICPNIINAYGSTESGPEITFTDIGDSLEEIANGYIGKLLPDQEIKIIDANDNEVPPGVVGEMIFRGSLTIKEYYNMPEENKATFMEGGWCRSGDLGYITEDGRIYIKGRKKFIIRVGSYTVLPTEVEDVAIQHPKVAMAAAVGFPDEIYNEVVWLAVVPKARQIIEEQEIIDLCKKELADFKVPKKILVMKELPITRLAKIDRPTLLNQIKNQYTS